MTVKEVREIGNSDGSEGIWSAGAAKPSLNGIVWDHSALSLLPRVMQGGGLRSEFLTSNPGHGRSRYFWGKVDFHQNQEN